MQWFLQHNPSFDELPHLNTCHIYLQALTISDLANAMGTSRFRLIQAVATSSMSVNTSGHVNHDPLFTSGQLGTAT